MIRELRSARELRAACGDDDLVMWAGQDLRPGGRAWALGGAVVAGCPQVSRGDRLAVWGEVPAAVELVRHALAELGPSYRPFGDVGLVDDVAAKLDGLEVSGHFSWMSLPGPPSAEATSPGCRPPAVALSGPVRPEGAAGGPVMWLGDGDEGEVAALLAADAPRSYAVPGADGVRRWAGMRVGGELAAVAADAWSAPSVGLLAGVATRDRLRGRGLGDRVCRWVSRELVAAHGRAALMVDDENAAALRLYERLGYRRRRVLATHVTG